jgi:hypothetical protein
LNTTITDPRIAHFEGEIPLSKSEKCEDSGFPNFRSVYHLQWDFEVKAFRISSFAYKMSSKRNWKIIFWKMLHFSFYPKMETAAEIRIHWHLWCAKTPSGLRWNTNVTKNCFFTICDKFPSRTMFSFFLPKFTWKLTLLSKAYCNFLQKWQFLKKKWKKSFSKLFCLVFSILWKNVFFSKNCLRMELLEVPKVMEAKGVPHGTLPFLRLFS